MLKIGDFSKLSRVSIRMLRYYDDIGLLKPAETDPYTAYRYYSENQLPVVSRITALKDMGFGLSAIGEMLAGDNDKETLMRRLRLKQAELLELQEQTAYRLRLLETALERLRKDDQAMKYDVTLKTFPTRYAATVRMTIPSYGEEGVLWSTLMSETAHQMTVGIGSCRVALEEIRESFSEARRAIEVGRIFQPESSIYVFDKLILERFLMELPQESSAYYHSLLFNRKTQRLFNEEMLYTIEMFFKKDLNLSDTARQLYIHRNTLVYRLDKVQRQTGLDLRKFDDAVTFKILMELKKCGGDKPPRK